MYDIIGDIHGHGTELELLLEKLGYSLSNGAYRHPERTAIFAGDFIDRGQEERKVINICRPMVEQGSALAVMGNHEFNAVCYATRVVGSEDDYLRSHRKPRNTTEHAAFLAEYPFESPEHQETIAWFKTLPLFLELDGIRVIHAVWHHPSLRIAKPWLDGKNCLKPDAYHAASDKDHPLYDAVEHLLKGIEMPLPAGESFQDFGGTIRTSARIKWWKDKATTLDQVAILAPPEPLKTIKLPEDRYRYQDDIPLFFGHYWFGGRPEPTSDKLACVDYSVAKPGGKLVAYRWSGESNLSADNYLWVTRKG
ncbi:metallophosphoesterase [Spongorhabdus nitratireducens]